MKNFIDEILAEHTISEMKERGVTDYLVLYVGNFNPISNNQLINYKRLVENFGSGKVIIQNNIFTEIKNNVKKYNPKNTALIIASDSDRLYEYNKIKKFTKLTDLEPYESLINPKITYYQLEKSQKPHGWDTLTEGRIKIFIQSEKFKKVLSEVSSTPTANFTDVDDGRLGPWYSGMDDYVKGSKTKVELYGMKIIDWMVGESKVGDEYERFLGYIFPAGDQANNVDTDIETFTKPNPNDHAGIVKGTYKVTKKHYDMYRQVMKDMAIRLGFEVLEYMDESPWDSKPIKQKDIKDITINEMLKRGYHG